GGGRTSRCSAYQALNPSGSRAEKKKPPMPRTRAMCRDDNPARRTWPVRRRGVATRCRSFGDSARHSNGARARLGHGGVQSHLTDCGMPSSVQLIRAPDLSDVEYAYAATAPQGSRLIFLAG